MEGRCRTSTRPPRDGSLAVPPSCSPQRLPDLGSAWWWVASRQRPALHGVLWTGWRSRRRPGADRHYHPILSSSHSTVVIDGIQLVGGAGYPAPRPFALRVIDYNQCAGPWPLRRTRLGLVLDGCNAYDLGPLVGHQVHWSGG